MSESPIYHDEKQKFPLMRLWSCQSNPCEGKSPKTSKVVAKIFLSRKAVHNKYVKNFKIDLSCLNKTFKRQIEVLQNDLKINFEEKENLLKVPLKTRRLEDETNVDIIYFEFLNIFRVNFQLPKIWKILKN